ncbi:hypothetical protein M9Y10_006856 [Tritrichomonas musculus]|uniref:Uncharacterized protein n=1 Tax=Tritrichomonas musculus TaxID=1915356 RepID=A0ABR2JGK1_9EUKA
MTNCCLNEKKKRYPHVSSKSFISSFHQVFIETCEKLGFDTKIIKELFEIMMDYYEPPNDEINDHPRK